MTQGRMNGRFARTLADQAAQVVGEEILSGRRPAGSRLHIRELAEQTGIGPTPMREGLSRLVARGLVVAVEQRGFRVAEMNRADLQDILTTRAALETEALRLSIANGDDHWEAGIVASLHRLVRFLQRVPEDARGAVVGELDKVHKAFHTSLIAACGSARMLDLHSVLHDQGFRYRHTCVKSFDPPEIAENHRKLAEIVLDRDADAAVEAYRDHLQLLVAGTYPETRPYRTAPPHSAAVPGLRAAAGALEPPGNGG